MSQCKILIFSSVVRGVSKEWLNYPAEVIGSNPVCFTFSEQCHNLISAVYKTSCKTRQGVDEMFADIARILVESNKSRMDLKMLDTESFKVVPPEEEPQEEEPPCLC